MVETLYQSIGNGVVGGHANALNTEELHEVSPEFRLKLCPLSVEMAKGIPR